MTPTTYLQKIIRIFSLVFTLVVLLPEKKIYANYYESGSVTSTNLLSGYSVTTIDSFGYNASSIPSGTTLSVQFSQDGSTWKNSSGVTDGWDALSQGDNTAEIDSIDISGLNWTSNNFYYKIQLESNATFDETPVLDEAIVYYTYNQTPTNTSLTFTNPLNMMGNIALPDNHTEWNFQATVADLDGYTDLSTVILRLANSSDNSAPYEDLEFTWTQSSNLFAETGSDTNDVATLTSTTANSSCASTSCTLDFKIKFNEDFTTYSTNYSAQLYTSDDSSDTDEDTYSNFYQVIPISMSISSPSDIDIGTITGTGNSDTGEGTWTIITNNPNGYKLEWQASVATMNNEYSDTISGYTPTVPETPETWSVASTASEWGARVKSTSTDFNSSLWGTDDSSNAKWLNVTAGTPFEIASGNSPNYMFGGSHETIQFKCQIGSLKFQPSGSYSVNITLTATSL